MHRMGKCHSSNYRLCAYIRKPKKGRFYTCIFIEKGFRKALRTDIFKKKAVFVCTFRADRGKYDQNAHIKSMKKPFSYVRLSQIIVPHRSNANHTAYNAITDADEWKPAVQKAPNSKIRDKMYKIQENLENTGLQLLVDKVQGPVGGFVKSVFANLKPSKPGGDENDNC